MSETTPLRLVLASANPDKVKEIVSVLGQVLSVELVARPADVPDVVEDAATLAGNARLKAQALVAATPGSTARATPGRAPRTPTTSRSSCES